MKIIIEVKKTVKDGWSNLTTKLEYEGMCTLRERERCELIVGAVDTALKVVSTKTHEFHKTVPIGRG